MRIRPSREPVMVITPGSGMKCYEPCSTKEHACALGVLDPEEKPAARLDVVEAADVAPDETDVLTGLRPGLFVEIRCFNRVRPPAEQLDLFVPLSLLPARNDQCADIRAERMGAHG